MEEHLKWKQEYSQSLSLENEYMTAARALSRLTFWDLSELHSLSNDPRRLSRHRIMQLLRRNGEDQALVVNIARIYSECRYRFERIFDGVPYHLKDDVDMHIVGLLNTIMWIPYRDFVRVLRDAADWIHQQPTLNTPVTAADAQEGNTRNLADVYQTLQSLIQQVTEAQDTLDNLIQRIQWRASSLRDRRGSRGFGEYSAVVAKKRRKTKKNVVKRSGKQRTGRKRTQCKAATTRTERMRGARVTKRRKRPTHSAAPKRKRRGASRRS